MMISIKLKMDGEISKRFSVQNELRFDEFKQLCIEKFKSLENGNPFDIIYVDEENKIISISSDDELLDSFDQYNRSKRKILTFRIIKSNKIKTLRNNPIITVDEWLDSKLSVEAQVILLNFTCIIWFSYISSISSSLYGFLHLCIFGLPLFIYLDWKINCHNNSEEAKRFKLTHSFYIFISLYILAIIVAFILDFMGKLPVNKQSSMKKLNIEVILSILYKIIGGEITRKAILIKLNNYFGYFGSLVGYLLLKVLLFPFQMAPNEPIEILFVELVFALWSNILFFKTKSIETIIAAKGLFELSLLMF